MRPLFIAFSIDCVLKCAAQIVVLARARARDLSVLVGTDFGLGAFIASVLQWIKVRLK